MQSSSQIVTAHKPTPSFFTGRIPFLSGCHPTNSVKALERNYLTQPVCGIYGANSPDLTDCGLLSRGMAKSLPTCTTEHRNDNHQRNSLHIILHNVNPLHCCKSIPNTTISPMPFFVICKTVTQLTLHLTLTRLVYAGVELS